MTTFTRDRFTWLAYFMLGYFAYLQASPGPFMPFLGAELNFSYAERGLHFSAFAVGIICAGLLADYLAQRYGRQIVFWAGGAGMGLSALLLILGQSVVLTVSSMFLMGLAGTWLLIMLNAALADLHNERRAVAFTEANIFASITGTLAPLLVSVFERTGIGWRGVIILAVLAWGLCLVLFRHTPVPKMEKTTLMASGRRERRLPGIFWVYWWVVLLIVSVEWCVIFWGADFLERVVGLAKVDAAGAISLYFLANIIGRTAGSRLTRVYSGDTLLIAAIGVGIFGFLLFWLSPAAPLNLIGLFVTGLGVSNLFPLVLSAATRLAPEQANTVGARVSLAAGLAILIMPQMLASVADDIGIWSAYAIVAGLLLGLLFATWFAIRLAARKAPQVIVDWR